MKEQITNHGEGGGGGGGGEAYCGRIRCRRNRRHCYCHGWCQRARALGGASGVDARRRLPTVAVMGRCAIAGCGRWVLASVGGERNEAASGGRWQSGRREGGRRV